MNQNKYDIKTVGEPHASQYANSSWKQLGSPNRGKEKKNCMKCHQLQGLSSASVSTPHTFINRQNYTRGMR